jgi:hypothetical protein
MSDKDYGSEGGDDHFDDNDSQNEDAVVCLF